MGWCDEERRYRAAVRAPWSLSGGSWESSCDIRFPIDEMESTRWAFGGRVGGKMLRGHLGSWLDGRALRCESAMISRLECARFLDTLSPGICVRVPGPSFRLFVIDLRLASNASIAATVRLLVPTEVVGLAAKTQLSAGSEKPIALSSLRDIVCVDSEDAAMCLHAHASHEHWGPARADAARVLAKLFRGTARRVAEESVVSSDAKSTVGSVRVGR